MKDDIEFRLTTQIADLLNKCLSDVPKRRGDRMV